MRSYQLGRPAIVCVLTALALAGCGGGSDAGDAVPAELVGTYTTTLERSDLPNADQPEFVDGGLEWTMRIATTGGPDGGPVLAFDGKDGNLEATSLRVEGDRLFFDNETCYASGAYEGFDNEYSWKLDGATLTLATVTNDCSDQIAETVLTSRSWAKQ